MFKRIVSILISAIMLISCLSALSAYAASVDVASAGAKLESTGNSKLDSFINDPRWTAGVSWNSAQRPKISSFNGWGCAAYCGDYVKYCFGSDNAKSGPVFYNASEIRAGDVITVGNPSNGRGHWFVVLKRIGDSLYVAEGNFNSMVRIGWNYSVSGNSIKGISYGFTAGYHYPVESTPAETVKPEAPSEPQPATEPKQDSGICGDISCDGKVNNRDAMMLDRCIAGWLGYADIATNCSFADMDGNGQVNNRDAMILDRCVAGWSGYAMYIIRIAC